MTRHWRAARIFQNFLSTGKSLPVAKCQNCARHVAALMTSFSNGRPIQVSHVSSSSRPDPFARRPNQKCDPYGQGGKPLGKEDAQRLLATVGEGWTLGSAEGSSDNTDIFSVLRREFHHKDFLSGSSFVNEIAAVAQMNDHYPSITLGRRLDSIKKAWQVVTTIECHTKVLGGLSHHDFFLATLIDIEIERPHVKELLAPQN